MRYKVTHRTTYDYDNLVPISHNLVHLLPRHLSYQRVEQAEIGIAPQASHLSQRIDFFGNRVDYFGIEIPHKQLEITATSTVTVTPEQRVAIRDDPSWEEVARAVGRAVGRSDGDAWIDAYQYTFPSPRVPRLSEAIEYARPSFPPGRGLVEASVDLMLRIHRDFEFDNTATDVLTPTVEVLANRRGVCQDFAHLQLACLRGLGLPARYVSGYLRTYPPPGKPRLVGVDASHAWVAICVAPGRWLELDPTNGIRPRQDHIVVAYGRDFSDVSPVDGVFIGGGDHRLTVSVDVAPVDTDAA